MHVACDHSPFLGSCPLPTGVKAGLEWWRRLGGGLSWGEVGVSMGLAAISNTGPPKVVPAYHSLGLHNRESHGDRKAALREKRFGRSWGDSLTEELLN